MQRSDAFNILQRLRDAGIPDDRILDYLVGNWMTGSDAADAMTDAHAEFMGDIDDDEEDYVHWTFV